MDWMFYPVIIWLALISWFDIRKGEIPHSLWIIVPLIAVGFFRVFQGDWQLVVLAAMVVAISERFRIARWTRFTGATKIMNWLPPFLLILFWSVQIVPFPALSILGFWIAWEFGWWGGADAVSAITLALVWPNTDFFIAFFGCHVVVALGLTVFTFKQGRKVKLHRLPGLPIMLVAVLCTIALLTI